MATRITRRSFVQKSSAVAAGYWVAGGVQAAESKSANEKVQFACIGIGGKGSSDSANAGKSGEVVGICDTDSKRLMGASKRFKGASTFADFREMLDTLGDKVDAVTVSTPDHTHAVAAAKAMSMGKHCFCQKPLTHTIYEARYLGELAKKMGVATEMGNQGTSNNGLREAAAITQSGGIGDVKEVHVWTNRPVWPQGGSRPESKPVPKSLSWDEWLGPAPERPYGNGYHPFVWRGWWDFGTGALGDMACHTFNMPFAALNLRAPVSVQAVSSGHNGESYPKWSQIHFVFPATDKRDAVDVYWYDGGKRPDASMVGKPLSSSGALLVGTEGKIYSPKDYGEEFEMIGADNKPLPKPKVEYDRSPGHFREWVRAIQGGEPAMSNFIDYAGPLTETILLGNLAVWAAAPGGEGKRVDWDAKKLVARDAPELATIVRSEYRPGWELAGNVTASIPQRRRGLLGRRRG